LFADLTVRSEDALVRYFDLFFLRLRFLRQCLPPPEPARTTDSIGCLVKSRVWHVSTQMPAEEIVDALPGIGSRRRNIACLVVRIHERVAGAVVHLEVGRLALALQLRLEFLHVRGRNPAVVGAEVP